MPRGRWTHVVPGDELAPLDLEALPAIVEDFRRKGVQAVAVCAMFSGFHGECPVEVAEARYGLAVESVALNPEQGGEGRWRGGKGFEIRHRARSNDNFLTLGYTRPRVPPWSLAGGRDGTTHFAEVIRTDGTRSRHAFANGVRLDASDVVRVVTGNGAGWGDPALRAPAAIRADLNEGLLTAYRAREVYGFAEDAGASHD